MLDFEDVEELFIGASVITDGFLNYIVDENFNQWFCNNGYKIWKKNNLISGLRGQEYAFLAAGTKMKYEIQNKRRSIKFFADRGEDYRSHRRYFVKYISKVGYTNKELALLRKQSKANKKKLNNIIKTYRLRECFTIRQIYSF